MQYKIIVDKQSRTNPTTQKKEYIIDIEELRCKGNVYDSLIITKDEDYVMRRLSLSEYNVLTVLEQPKKEVIKDINIELFEGDNYIYLADMVGNKFYAEYLIKNDFTEIYATRNEMNSAINQTAQQIELTVNQKLTGYSTTEEMNSAITQKADSITSSVSKTYATKGELNTAKTEIKQTTDSITSTVNKKFENYSTTTQMNSAIEQKANSITSTVSSTYETKANASDKYATKTQLATAKSEIKQTTDSITSTVSKKVGNNEIISKINQSAEKVGINANKIELSANDILNLLAGNTINMTSKNIVISSNKFSVDKNGKMTCSDARITGGQIKVSGLGTSTESIRVENSENTSEFTYVAPTSMGFIGSSGSVYIAAQGEHFYNSSIDLMGTDGYTSVSNLGISTPKIENGSLKSIKKNIRKLNTNAIELIKNADICSYNLKSEKKGAKKHIGLVIGEGYNCPDEVISENGQGVEQYSMTSVAWKAIQELIKKDEEKDKQILELTERLNKLEAIINEKN